jgi:hypothetical protein
MRDIYVILNKRCTQLHEYGHVFLAVKIIYTLINLKSEINIHTFPNQYVRFHNSFLLKVIVSRFSFLNFDMIRKL